MDRHRRRGVIKLTDRFHRQMGTTNHHHIKVHQLNIQVHRPRCTSGSTAMAMVVHRQLQILLTISHRLTSTTILQCHLGIGPRLYKAILHQASRSLTVRLLHADSIRQQCSLRRTLIRLTTRALCQDLTILRSQRRCRNICRH